MRWLDGSKTSEAKSGVSRRIRRWTAFQRGGRAQAREMVQQSERKMNTAEFKLGIACLKYGVDITRRHKDACEEDDETHTDTKDRSAP